MNGSRRSPRAPVLTAIKRSRRTAVKVTIDPDKGIASGHCALAIVVEG